MPKRILVADESPTIRNVTQSLLKKKGYDVLFARDGEKAIAIAQADKPDLVFLDDHLPILNGGQVCEKLKRNESLKDIPVVMFLSKDEAHKQEELSKRGVTDFITKPFNPREIINQVERIFERKKTSSESNGEKVIQDIALKETERSEIKQIPQISSSLQEQKSDDVLDIVETSALVEDFEQTIPDSDTGVAHGFDWFLSELKRETKEEEKIGLPAEKKSSPADQLISDKGTEQKKEEKVYKIDEHQKGYEDFLKELKEELEELPEQAKQKSKEKLSVAWSDAQFSDLKERISERIAHEVAKKITPELLEKVIREEIDRIGKERS